MISREGFSSSPTCHLLRQGGKNDMAFAKKGEKMKEYKRTDINKNLWVLDYGDDKFEIFLRAWGPLGAFVYRYEKGRLKWYQRRSYSGVSSVKYFNFFK